MSSGDDFSLAFGGVILLRPLWLIALLPLGLLLWRLARAPQDASSGWHAVVDAHLLPHLTAAAAPRRRHLALVMLGTGLVATVLALSGPALPGKTELAFRGDAARVVVIDLSPTLAEQDSAGSRLERLHLKLLNLLHAMPDGQTALIVYAEEPYLLAPLTSDTTTLGLLIPELAPDVMPVAGDRPERALRMARDVLLRSGATIRDVLWVTATTSPPPATLQIADEMRAHGLRLSLLQLSPSSAPGAALIRLQDSARLSGGLLLTPRPDDSDTRQLASLFAANTGTATDGTRSTGTPRDIGPWLLPLLLPLVALAFRRGVLLALALPMLLQPPPAHAVDIAGWWSTADQRAVQYLRTGDPDKAARHFTDPRWQAVAHYRAKHYAAAAAALAPFADADSLYNRGNALAHLGRLDEAVQALDAALHLHPDDADIRHNRDLVRDLLDRKATPPPPATDSDVPAGNASPRTPENSPLPKEDRSGPTRPSDRAGAPPEHGSGNRPDTHNQTGAPPQASPAWPGTGSTAPHSGAAQDLPAQTVPVKPQTADNASPATDTSRHGRSDPVREAGLLADQWLRGVPDEPAGLLRRKLLLEHQRRQSGETPRRWQ